MKKHYFPLFIFLLSGIGILASCGKPMPVSFAGYRNIRFSNQGFATGIIQMEVAFYNPNSFPMKIKGTDLQVFINKQPFGQVTQDSASQMPAKDTFLMPVSMKVNLIDLLQKVLHTSGQDSVMLEASGSCKIGRGGVFVNVPLHYRSKEILKMF